jgi:hypothetical protein
MLRTHGSTCVETDRLAVMNGEKQGMNGRSAATTASGRAMVAQLPTCARSSAQGGNRMRATHECYVCTKDEDVPTALRELAGHMQIRYPLYPSTPTLMQPTNSALQIPTAGLVQGAKRKGCLVLRMNKGTVSTTCWSWDSCEVGLRGLWCVMCMVGKGGKTPSFGGLCNCTCVDGEHRKVLLWVGATESLGGSAERSKAK